MDSNVAIEARLRLAWDRFWELSRRYWWLYVAAWLLEDRIQNYFNDRIDEAIVSDIVTAPFILLAFVIAALLILAYVETRRPTKQSTVTPPDDFEALTKAVDQLQERYMKQAILTKEREDQIAILKPKADWAESLIAREDWIRAHLSSETRFWSINLTEREPYFEIAIWLRYIGVLQLTVGESVSGRLVWDGRPFSQEPVITLNGEPLPGTLIGPTEAQLRIRQYVTPATAVELQALLDRGVEEIEFVAKDFHVSLSKATFAGDVIAKGELFGEYLAVDTTRNYRVPPGVRPSFDTEDSPPESEP